MVTKTVLVPKCPHSMIWQIRRVHAMHRLIASVLVAIGVALVKAYCLDTKNLEVSFWILGLFAIFFS